MSSTALSRVNGNNFCTFTRQIQATLKAKQFSDGARLARPISSQSVRQESKHRNRCLRPIDKSYRVDGCKQSSLTWSRTSSTVASWSEIIQSITQTNDATSNDGSHDSNINKVNEQLNNALGAKRSHEQGNLLPQVVASEICRLYSSLSSKEDKFAFFNLLSSSLDVDQNLISKAILSFNQSASREEATHLKARERLSSILDPPYKHLLKEIGHLEEGVKTLVNMRKDLLELFSSKPPLAITPHMQAFERHLKQHLAQWFSAGFLDLQRVTWQSPASLLEKIMTYEQVHPTAGWDDFKRRLDEDRRCFIFTHRLLPGEPLVMIHCALGDHLRSNMEGIHLPAKKALTGVKAATFYTISSTQKGLSGIDLGNYLIKVVAQELKKEFSTIVDLGTLSPIPGFSKWLAMKLKSDEDYLANVWKSFCDEDVGNLNLESFSDWLLKIKENEIENSGDVENNINQRFLLSLCARYLYSEKRRGFALDPVANFHLRNGAILWRMNWMADKSVRGMNRSYGIMTNYKYDLSQIEQNNKQYVVDGKIAVSDAVLDLIN